MLKESSIPSILRKSASKITSKITSKSNRPMDSYQPPFEITSKVLSQVASISEKIGRLGVTAHLDSKPNLRRINRIRSIHSSLRIEASSLSWEQVRDVIEGRVVLGDRREILEVQNAYAAYATLPRLDPFDLGQLKRLHGVMTKGLVAEPGAFRSGEEGVFRGDRCIFMAPPADLVPTLMKRLFEWMEEVRPRLHPLILGAVFHYEFVFIHPFTDGNGRMARLWHTAILSRWKEAFAYLPLKSQVERFQDDYYEAIGQCHAAGSSTRFIEFILGQIDFVLKELSSRIARGDEELPETVRKLLAAMEYEVPYTAIALMKRLRLKSRATFRKNYLHPAIALGLVRMAIPEKPQSRNQRYVKN